MAASRNDKTAKLTKGAKIALAALHEAIGECGEVPPASNHIPPGVKAVTVKQWRDYAYRGGISHLRTSVAMTAKDAVKAFKSAGTLSKSFKPPGR